MLRLGRKTTQLEGRAIQFAIEPHRAKVGFLVGQRHQRFAPGFQCVGQAAQQGGTGSRRGGAKRGERIAGRTHEGVELAGCGVLKGHGAW